MKTFKDVYQFPLKQSHGKAYDQKENFVFQFLFSEDEEIKSKLLSVINSKEDFKNDELLFEHKEGIIVETLSGLRMILIRGWGNLTGGGTMNLPIEEAANIQDTFADYIVERLNFRENK